MLNKISSWPNQIQRISNTDFIPLRKYAMQQTQDLSKQDQKSKSSYPSPDKSTFGAHPQKRDKPALSFTDNVVPEDSSINRINHILDQVNFRTLKKKPNDESSMPSARGQTIESPGPSDSNSQQKKGYYLKKPNMITEPQQETNNIFREQNGTGVEQVKRYEDLYQKLKTTSNENENYQKQRPEKKNYIHLRNNTTQFEEEQFIKLTVAKRKTNQEISFDTVSKANTNMTPIPESLMQHIKVARLTDKDKLITVILKAEKPENVTVEQFIQYFEDINVSAYNQLLSRVYIERVRYLIKVSLVYEWMAVTINFMIKVAMINNKSASDQMRFTKVIYANYLALHKNLLESIDTVCNQINNNLQDQSNETLRVSVGFIETKCNQFFFLNQAITSNLAQLNTLLSYITESIIIMNISDKRLQDQAREYYRLRVDTTDLQIFYDVIRIYFLSEIQKFMDCKNSIFNISERKKSQSKNARSKSKSQSPQPLVPLTIPYLPASNNDGYTLVLDLDETLVHFQEQNNQKHILVRPYVDTFLKEMSKIYELVVFTAGLENYANWFELFCDSYQGTGLNRSPQIQEYVTHRLYRQHTQFQTLENNYLKDLTKLGRPLEHTIIIDNTPQNFNLQPQNGIQIRTWFNDPNDTALNDLIPVLKQIRERNGDVRQEMRLLRQKLRNVHSFVLPN